MRECCLKISDFDSDSEFPINQIVISIFYGFRIRLDGTSGLITFGCVICNDYDFSRSGSGLSTTEFGALDPDHLGELCSPGVQYLRGFLKIVILMGFIPKKETHYTQKMQAE